MVDNPRYVFCRPRGGFNDNLNQLQICADYCKKYDRTLIISEKWGSFFNWSTCLTIPHPTQLPESSVNYLKFTTELDAELAALSCYTAGPPVKWCEHDIKKLLAVDKDLLTRKHTINPPAITFDMSQDYTENILVYTQSGGGPRSHTAIKNFKAVPELATKLHDLREKHPDYISVHVRNTDYVSNYSCFLEEIKEKHPTDSILLCTDDYNCHQAALDIFGNSLFFVSSIPQNKEGCGIHYYTAWDYGELEASTLIDLLMLGHGRIFYKCPIAGTYSKSDKYCPTFSGFSNLAEYLNKNKQVLLALTS